jgi:hypothetical protein
MLRSRLWSAQPKDFARFRRNFALLSLVWHMALPWVARAQGVDKPILNVLVPLGVLSEEVVSSFEKESGALIRTGFLSTASDTDGRVRLGSMVWDVVLSDEIDMIRLQSQGRLASLDASSPATRFENLFFDPVGMICKPNKRSKAPVQMRWHALSRSLIEAGLEGEVVLDLPEAVHAILADAVAKDAVEAEADGGMERLSARVAYPDKPSMKDSRIAWLGTLYRATRAAKISVDAELLRDRVSCVLTYHSQLPKFLAYFVPGAPNALHFHVPDGLTVARRLAVGVTEESPRAELARRFVAHLNSHAPKLALAKGFCPVKEKSGMPQSKACEAAIVRHIDELPVLSTTMIEVLRYGHRGLRPPVVREGAPRL